MNTPNKQANKNQRLALSHLTRGVTLVNLERYDEAIEAFTQAIALDPYNAQVYFRRGGAYVGLERYDDALKDYDRAIELDPNDPDAYFNRGNIYAEAQFGFLQAMADFRKTIELDPNNPDAYVNLGVLYVKRGMLESGLGYLEKAAKMGDSLGMQFAELVRKELSNV